MRLPPARLSSRDMLSFSGQLARLYESGVPVRRALEVLAESGHSRPLRDTARALSWRLEDGATLAESVAAECGRFPGYFAPLAAMAERWGGMDAVFRHVHAWCEERRRIGFALLQQLAYPVALLMAILVGIPLLRLFLLSVAQPGIPLLWPGLSIIVGGLTPVAAIAAAVFLYRRFRPAQLLFAAAGAHLWPLSPVWRRLNYSWFAWTLGLQWGLGVPAEHALHNAARLLPPGRLRRQLGRSALLLHQGASWADALAEAPALPTALRNAIGVGETSGRLDETLAGAAAEYYRKALFLTQVMLSCAGVAFFLLIAYGACFGLF